ncbi:MAG: hypothetical protein DMF88_04850 [Acidobacteria bacterium]|nr:MAG: hypothetical protein DMF88_04850 [Acidobacteriota bacterium]
MSVVTVEIAGQRYPIRSGLDERYIAELAAYVDQKMRAGARHPCRAQRRRRLLPGSSAGIERPRRAERAGAAARADRG